MTRMDVVERELDELVNDIGFGRYQMLVILTCGLGNAADAVELMALSYVLPVLKEELPAWGMSLITSAVFAGMFLGGIIFGCISDRIGRRHTLCACCLINAAFGIGFSLAPISVYPMALLRFGGGIGIGGSVPLVFSIAPELVAAANRGAHCLPKRG